MHIDKGVIERMEKEATRNRYSMELDIRSLSDLLANFIELFSGEAASDIVWALENISDESSSIIAENVAIAESLVSNMYAKYLFKGGINV